MMDRKVQCLSVYINMSCANCVSMRERVYYAFLEFKSARSFIIPLQEHMNVINAPEATNLTKLTQRSESSVCDQVN
jgi:hypothetical protein